MLVEYINEFKIKKSNYKEILKYNDIQIINPKYEDFIKAGYKELIEDETPVYNDEIEYLAINYEETKDNVLKHYEIKGVIEDED